MSRIVALALLGILIPQGAWAAPPKPEVPTTEVGDLSQQGSRRGAVEIGLGVLLSGTGAGLIAFGTLQLVRAREHVEFCNQGITVIDEQVDPSGGGIDPCVFDPPALGFASAGLSWGFAIPLLVGAGMLFHRARRVRADARAWDRLELTLAPSWQRGRGSATLVLRF